MTSSRLGTGSSAVRASSIAASTVERSLKTGMRMERPPVMVGQFDRAGRRPTAATAWARRDRAGARRALRRSPPGVALAFSVNAATGDGRLERPERRAGELVERRRDVGAERDRELHLARVDLEPATARVLAYAIDLERRRSGAGRDERAAQAEAEHAALPRGEERLLGAAQVLERVHVGAVVRVHLEVEVWVAVRVARVAVPGDLLAGRHLRAVGNGERDSLTQPPLLSFRAVRSLFRWM